MGAPKRQRKKYSKPSHPWQKERILEEKELLQKYGLKRKYEIWKMNSILKGFSSQAKKLIAGKTGQVETERNQLLRKLNSLGLLDKNATVADVLSMTLKDVMGRRLQTLVHKKNLARSVSQARQFIIHRHITVGNKRITTPSYLVPVGEEVSIQFVSRSTLSNPSHPERFVEEKKSKKKTGKMPEKAKEEKKEAGDKKPKTQEKKAKEKGTKKREKTPGKETKEKDPKKENTKGEKKAEEDKKD